MPDLDPPGDADRLNIYRIFASMFVIAGGLFWAAVVFVGQQTRFGASLASAAGSSLLWIALTVSVFGVGLRWERVAAMILAVAAVAVIGYGAATGWEPGVWSLIGVWILAPTLISGVLYLAAAREHRRLGRERGTEASDGPGARSDPS